jgi:hypothetical protein
LLLKYDIRQPEIDYFFKDLSSEKIHYLKIMQGENIFTPCNEIHATYFPIKTQLIVSSKYPRDQETYEKDTVRVPLITTENISKMLQKYAHKE